MRCWSEEARTDFVSEFLHHRVDDEIASFAVADDSVAVKKAAVSGLMWTGSESALIRVLESMDAQTFEEIALSYCDRMPPILRPRAIAAMRKFVETTPNHTTRLRTALDLIGLGETGFEGVVKNAMAALPDSDEQKLELHFIRPALEFLHDVDPAWTGRWVATRIAEGVLYGYEEWLSFATVIPDDLVETYLHRLETEDLETSYIKGMIAVIAAQTDAKIARRVFTKLRELQRKVDAEPGERHEFEWRLIRQLEAVFRGLPDHDVASGILSSVKSGDPLDIKVAAGLVSRVARSDLEPLRLADADLKARLRAYLKSSVNLVLNRDDYNGEEKADLASSIAQVGEPEDMADLARLIRADIDRMRRGRAAYAAGDHGLLGNGGSVTYAAWHVAAVIHLDPDGAEDMLINLLSEPEYSSASASAMAREFMPKRGRSLVRKFPYKWMWAAREGRTSPLGDNQRRKRFAAALNAEIKRLREQSPDGEPAAGVGNLARALAAIDGRGSAATVLGAIAMPRQWDQYTHLEAAERLLMAGVVLPATTAFGLVDSVMERTGTWMSDSDRHLLCQVLTLCPFVDDPSAGIAKMRDVIERRRLRRHELRELVTALGESRSDSAADLLSELASDTQAFEQCGENFINALAVLDTPRARELLAGFVDPDIQAIAPIRRPHLEDALVAQLTELARRRSAAGEQLMELCERDLPEINREILSGVMGRLGTSEALAASLNLIDDAKNSPVPRGLWDQLESAFVERRSHEDSPYAFTLHARAANELRVQLLRMVFEDRKRQRSALMILAQIEVWRLEYGRPTDEPRHPDLASGYPWPLRETDFLH